MCRFPEMFVVEAVEGGAKVLSHPVYLGWCVCVPVKTLPPDQTKNDTDLKFGTQTSLDHL